MNLRGVATALALLATLIVVPTGVAADPTEPAAEAAQIDTWVTDRMQAHGIPGAAVAIVRGGRTVHLRGYGTADGSDRPVTTDTPFLIGSVSKPFTAHVVRELVDGGVLALDEPVLPHVTHLVNTPPDGFEDVTVRHLLTHTAGIGMLVGHPGNVFGFRR
jgi:CubicO group peptidase (beta-lactamase class C family)